MDGIDHAGDGAIDDAPHGLAQPRFRHESACLFKPGRVWERALGASCRRRVRVRSRWGRLAAPLLMLGSRVPLKKLPAPFFLRVFGVQYFPPFCPPRIVRVTQSFCDDAFQIVEADSFEQRFTAAEE